MNLMSDPTVHLKCSQSSFDTFLDLLTYDIASTICCATAQQPTLVVECLSTMYGVEFSQNNWGYDNWEAKTNEGSLWVETNSSHSLHEIDRSTKPPTTIAWGEMRTRFAEIPQDGAVINWLNKPDSLVSILELKELLPDLIVMYEGSAW